MASRRRLGAYFTLGFLAVLVIGFFVARYYFSGPRLARFLTQTIFGRIYGRVEIDSADWPMLGLLGSQLPADVHGLRIYDPAGTLVLEVKHLTATIDWPKVVFGQHDVLVDDVVLHDGRAIIQEVPALSGPDPTWVGFIAAFKEDPAKIPPGPEPEPTPGPLILASHLTLEDVEVHLVFLNWNAHLHGVSGQGYLRQSFRKPLEMDFTYGLDAQVARGSVEFAGLHFDVVDVHANRFGQYPHEKDTLAYSATARTVDGADLRIDGKLKHIYDPDPNAAEVELRIDAYDAGLLLSRLTGGYLFGRPAGTLVLAGKMVAPVLTAEARGIDLVLPAPLTIEHAGLTLALASSELDLAHASLRGLGGRAEARAQGNMSTMVLTSGTLTITDPMNLGSFLPAPVAREIGTELSGQVHLSALPYMVNADRLNLQLGRLAIHGGVKLLGGELRVPSLALATPEASATVSGTLVPASGRVSADFKLSAANLGPIFGRLGLPPLAQALDVPAGTLRGTLEAPVVAGRATVIGLPLTPRVDAELAYQHSDRRLTVKRATGDPLGGTASVSGTAFVGRHPRLTDARVEADRLDLARLPGTGGLLAGTARLRLDASGAIERPRGTLSLDVDKLALGKTSLGTLDVDATADERRGVSISRLRMAGGRAGSFDVTGQVGWAPYPLALSLTAKDLPLSAIPEAPPAPGHKALDLTGKVGADLRITGTARRPAASGRILLAGLALFDTILGSGTLTLSEEPGGRVHVLGRLFQNKIGIDASVAVGGPLGIDCRGRITLHKLDLDELLADELGRLSAHGWVSATIDVVTVPSLLAEVHITDVHVELDGNDAEGRPAPIIVENQGEIAARYDDERREVRLLSPAVFQSERGGFTLEGSASPQKLAVRLRGDVQLRLLEFYTRRWLDGARGALSVDVALGGTADKPTLDGKIAFQDAAVTPRAQESEIKVPSGELIFSLDQVRAVGLAVEIDGQRLQVDGSTKLAGLVPVALDASVTGRIAGKLLEMLAPEQITHAAGSAEVRVTVKGTAQSPQVAGEVVFDQSFELAPRALRREIVLSSGRVRFSQNRVIVDRVSGRIDEGRLDVSGGATLGPSLQVALRVDVEGFTHRVPGVLEVELATGVRGLNVGYAGGQLSVRGDIGIVDGRYAQPLRFDRFASNIAFPERTVEVSDPFWKESPLLANMQLDLNVETKGPFAVTNQLITLTLDGRLNITGTPPRPVFSGTVESRSGEGTVRIPGTKIREFQVTQARVDFSPYATFPTSTPTVNLRAEAPFVDLNATEHRVYLEITGTLSRYEWKLWTSTGLTQAQTLALITFGRVTDDLRARVRGAVQPTPSNSSLGPTATATGSATDEVLNELSGDVIDALIADTLRSLLSLDCFNLSVSGTSVRASACKKLGAIFTLTGQYEQGVNWYRYDAGLTLRPSDDLSFVLQGWGVKSIQEAEGTQNAVRLQLKYNFVLR